MNTSSIAVAQVLMPYYIITKAVRCWWARGNAKYKNVYIERRQYNLKIFNYGLFNLVSIKSLLIMKYLYFLFALSTLNCLFYDVMHSLQSLQLLELPELPELPEYQQQCVNGVSSLRQLNNWNLLNYHELLHYCIQIWNAPHIQQVGDCGDRSMSL